MSNSIMLGEIASLNATTDIRGSRITNATGGISFTTFHGPNSVTGDVLTACDETITDDRLGGMMGRSENRGDENVAAASRSAHPDGVNPVMRDGSTRLFTDHVDLTGAWRLLSTIAGQEAVSE